MSLAYAIMLLTFFLALFHFLYGYKEAIRISNEDGLVNGWSIIVCLPLGFVFSHLASIFYQQI